MLTFISVTYYLFLAILAIIGGIFGRGQREVFGSLRFKRGAKAYLQAAILGVQIAHCTLKKSYL